MRLPRVMAEPIVGRKKANVNAIFGSATFVFGTWSVSGTMEILLR